MTDAEARPVRVRVAPSPTGDPHVGTAYIALFNYAFARSRGGKFILRIEDTDRERSTKESERAIFEALHWVGLAWDEGPDVGGPHGPYRQSERAEIYREHAARLVAKGAAYPCFCTPERLAALREEQKARKENFGYDGACKRLSHADVEAKLAAGTPHVIRLNVPAEGETVVRDLIRGDVVFKNAAIDDQVLIKSDGFPTYHLANVVDDRLMGVTHVIRAEEWVSSTPKHLLLYAAFGWEPPRFIHMPLLRNPDKSKISKRKNPTSLLWYREQGYLPEALLNFLGLMGYSFPDEREEFDLDAMVEEFSWDRVTTSAPVFDLQKLDWLNGVYIRDIAAEELVDRIRAAVPAAAELDRELMIRTVPVARERLKKLTDYMGVMGFLFADEVTPSAADLIPKKTSADDAIRILETAGREFAEVEPWTTAALEDRARALVEELGVKGRSFFMCLRVAVTGSAVSPPLFESMELLGRGKTLSRLAASTGILKRLGRGG